MLNDNDSTDNMYSKDIIDRFILNDSEDETIIINDSEEFKVETNEMISNFTQNLHQQQKIINFRSVKDFVSGVAAGAPATRHAISKLDGNTYETFFEMVEELLSDYSTTNSVALPTQAHIVLAVPAA